MMSQRVDAAEARAAEAERQAQSTQQALSRSQHEATDYDPKGTGKGLHALVEPGIGAFASKYQPQQFEGKEDKWKDWNGYSGVGPAGSMAGGWRRFMNTSCTT